MKSLTLIVLSIFTLNLHAISENIRLTEAELKVVYDDGRGVEFIKRKNLADYEKDCENSNQNACLLMGFYFGMNKNYEKGAEFLQKACAIGGEKFCRSYPKTPESLKEYFERGITDYYHEKDNLYIYGHEALKRLCEGSNSGKCYIYGKIRHALYGESNGWLLKKYVRACDYHYNPNSHACTSLENACDLGSGDACWAITNHYDSDLSDEALSLYWKTLYTKGCAFNNSESCSELADIYYDGWGAVEQNYTKAFQLHKKACDELSYDPSCKELIKIYSTGKGVAKNNQTSFDRIKKLREEEKPKNPYYRLMSAKDNPVQNKLQACEANDFKACYLIGRMYDQGRGLLCDSNNESCFFVKDLSDTESYRNKSKSYYDKAIKLAQPRCNKKDGLACVILARIYNPIFTKKDEKKALDYYKMACSANHAFGCYHYAIFWTKMVR